MRLVRSTRATDASVRIELLNVAPILRSGNVARYERSAYADARVEMLLSLLHLAVLTAKLGRPFGDGRESALRVSTR